MPWYHPRMLPRFLRFVLGSFMRNEGLETAKSLTYTSLFAVVPLITLVVAILAAFPAFQVFGGQIQNMLFDRLLPSSGQELEAYLETFAAQARNLTWVGAVMLLATAFLMLRNVESSFNRIWGVREQRKGLAGFLLYWSVLSLGPLLLGLGFAISSYITSLSLFESFSEMSEVIGARSLVLELFPVLLTIGAFTLLYVAVPNCGVQLRHALAGAVVVALSFKVAKWVFTLSIATASYQFVYGTFAAIPIFLLWIYVGWLMILFGANLVRDIPIFSTTTTEETVHPSLLLLALLHLFWEKQQKGESLRIGELMDDRWPLSEMPVERLLAVLEQQQLVRGLAHDEYILARDLGGVRVWDILGATPWAQPAPADLERPLAPVVAAHLPDEATLRKHFLRVSEVATNEFATSIGTWFRSARSQE